MIRKIATIAVVTGAALSCSVAANAMDFYATPLNSGAPTNLPGENLVPGVAQSMQMMNTVTQPLLQPMLAPGGMAPGAEASAAAAAPMHHHYYHHHHMYMKHKMMMKKKMSAMPKQM